MNKHKDETSGEYRTIILDKSNPEERWNRVMIIINKGDNVQVDFVDGDKNKLLLTLIPGK
jgi:hypothetical protein